MDKIKYILVGLLLGVASFVAVAAPVAELQRSVIPETDNTFYVGTTSPSNLRYKGFYLATSSSGCASFSSSGELYSVGTACGSGSSALEFDYGTNIFSQTSAATSSALEINSTGTSTFAGGIEAWRQVGAPYFHATSTTATSTFANGVAISNGLTVNGTTGLSYLPDKIFSVGGVPTAGTNNTPSLVFLKSKGNTDPFILQASTGANDFLKINQSGSALGLYIVENGTTEIRLDAGDVSYFNTGFNFGIGTTSPYAPLSVVGTGGVVAENYTATGTAASTFAGSVGIGSTTPYAKLSVTNTGTGPSFVVEDSTSPDSTPFVVDASGNVGIGVANPQTNLVVAGQVAIGGDVGSASLLRVYENTSAVGATAGATIEQDGTGDALLQFLLTGTKRWQMGIDNSNTDSFSISDNNDLSSTPAFVITTTDNIGIGTTTPNWKLQVVDTTGPQLALTDSGAGKNLKHWTMRSAGGYLYLATSTDAYATSTTAALSIDPNGLTTFLGRFRGGRQTLLQFTAADNDPPSTNFATFDTRNDHPVLTFGSTATTSAMFKGIMPQVYGGNGVSVILHFAQSTSTITDSVNWSVAFERLLDGTDDLDSWGFAATTTVTATPNGTSGVLATATLNFADGSAMDSIGIGDTFRVSVARDLNDTSSTTQQLLSVEIREQ